MHPSNAFEDGFRIERPDGLAVLVYRHLGKIGVTSGRIAACDPFIASHDVPPLSRTVPVGHHEVEVSVLTLPSGEQRVAFARLRFGTGTPLRWENAAPDGEPLESLEPGQLFGYPVDAGTGCFGDLTALRAFDECGDDATSELFEALNRTQVDTWAWANVVCGDEGENLLCFSTGWGDGFYPSYWGFAEGDTPVCLVTDFGVCDVEWK